MRIQITKATLQRGWDNCDHLLDESALDEVIGRSYKTVEHARRAVAARSGNRFFFFEYTIGGSRYRYDSSAGAGIPGRHVPRIVEVR